jgi:hypothetical protein
MTTRTAKQVLEEIHAHAESPYAEDRIEAYE